MLTDLALCTLCRHSPARSRMERRGGSASAGTAIAYGADFQRIRTWIEGPFSGEVA